MRFLNKSVLSGANNANQTGSQLDSNQWVSASFHLVPADSAAQGTFKLQASNDVPPDGKTGPNAQQFVVTNWIDIPNQSAAITAGAQALLTIANMAYRWVRATWTSTAVRASRAIQDLTYTAVAYGVSGNSVTIAYVNPGTAGAALSVGVIGSAISVNLATASVPATLIVQDLTYTAVAGGTGGNSITIAYIDDAPGGPVTVSVVGNAISVHIESGVTIATAIRTAVLASGPAAALVGVAVSGTGSNTQVAAGATPLAGGSQAITSTATQVKAAVDAFPAAAALVTVAVTGTGSNVQSAVSATALQNGAGSSALVACNMNALSI